MDLKHLGRSLGIAVLTIALTLGAGKALALNVLSFDPGNTDRSSTVGAFGFSMTQMGTNGIAGVDFGAYDLIYVAQSYQDFLAGDLALALSTRQADINTFLANGGGLVFGAPVTNGLPGGIFSFASLKPIFTELDLSSLGQPPMPLPAAPSTEGNDRDGESGRLAGVPPAVPEPGTMALFGLGIAALAAAVRKRRS